MQQSQLYRFYAPALHVLAWAFLLLLPVLFSGNDPPGNSWFYIRTWTPILLMMLVFYANYLLLTERFLFTRRFWLFVLLNLSLFVLCFYLNNLVRHAFDPGLRPQGRRGTPPGGFLFFRAMLSYTFAAAISVAIQVTGRWYTSEQQRRLLENEHLKSKLAGLRYQLQPHFFFNTLNNIYALVEASPQQAQETIHGLSKMMRYLLYESNVEHIQLQKEISFLKNYIQLMKIRLPPQVQVSESFPKVPPRGLEVAPLLFISLVENAFKHGVSPLRPGFIRVQMLLEEAEVQLITENSCFPASEQDMSEPGIGLQNLRRRLELLYPGQHELHQQRNGDTFYSRLTIRL